MVGLDRGGSCRGRPRPVRDWWSASTAAGRAGGGYKVAPADAEATLAYLWKRELNTNSYVAKRLALTLPKRRVTAWAFVANHANPTQYAGKLAPDEAARRVARGHGVEGSALEYLANTLEHLAEMGIKEGPLHAILEMAREKAERKG